MAIHDLAPSETLYLGNLDPQVTEAILYDIFIQAGPIDRVNIAVDDKG